MELPSRQKGDVYTKAGEYPALRQRIRSAAVGLSIPTVVVYAFDKRTRLLPFYFSSHRMAPAGPRAVGAALHESGLTNTRIVLQQWNPNFRPSRASLDGEPIEMLLVSSMQIHAERAYRLVADACSKPAADRPLIIAGGPKAIYEPSDMFEIGGDPNVTADVVVTGEEFVLMQLVETLLDYRGTRGTMREAFLAARRDGALVDIPGLVYPRDDGIDAPLVTTGIQRLVENLDEMPHPLIGYTLLERPHRKPVLQSQPLPTSRVGRHSIIGSLTISHGCKFNCDYCPIPAYNQRTYRHKSGERIVDEMRQLREQLGIRFFFGTDDNFFNNRPAVEQMFETMSGAMIAGKPLRKAVRWGTEATEFDTWKNRDLLGPARVSGLRAIWLGIEDLTATLIKKGQSVSKTADLFALMNKTGICPMPMMMHHDGQPLFTRGSLYGLLNQIAFLRRSGAQSMQITALTPAVGTRSYEPLFENGSVFDTVGKRPVRQHQFDGNHVVASTSRKPWRNQLNVLCAYAAYYNPINFVRTLVRPANSLYLAGLSDQLRGMIGLVPTAIDSVRWAYRLWRGPVTRTTSAPGSKIPVIDVSPKGAERVDSTPKAALGSELVQLAVGQN
ncbi:MAG: B12-binding domain-containing radical SAM protein [Planctomycetes bacterium]|nr:B12-binding domain-containing radical SAM protein [Planctomycetota bacterium]